MQLQDKTRFQAKDVLFREGHPAEKLYLIRSGEVLCLKSSKDRLIPVFRAEKGDIIGESAMIAGDVYGYSAITLSDVEVIPLPAENFQNILKESPDWLVDLTATMISRFEKTASLIAENRVINPAIAGEEDFSSSQEVEFKKLLNQ